MTSLVIGWKGASAMVGMGLVAVGRGAGGCIGAVACTKGTRGSYT